MAGRGLPSLAFLFIVTSVAVSSVFSGGGVTRPEGAVQDVSLVIKYSRSSYTPESAYCVTGDLHESLTSTLLPNHAYGNNVSANLGNYKTVTWNGLSGVRGVTCLAGGKHAVAGPVMHPQATLIPGRLSITLNKGEDLRLPLHTPTRSTSRQVLWQKEPWKDSAWKKATLTHDNELFIPLHALQGSGIYSVIPEPAVTHTTQWPNEYSVFHLLVRECPAQRYGSNCTNWCPDCLHGGVCDARSGECVCPAGVMGHRCQTLCKDGYIGRNCTMYLGSFPRRRVVCVSAPLGCTCAPGYHGDYCDTECPHNTWGVNCAQTCRDCWWYCSGWGHCYGKQKRPCGEGDLGLPRLRQPPDVTSITSQSAVVSFRAWRQDYDDGESPSGGNLDSYLLQYWQPGQTTLLQNPVRLQTSITTITTQLADLEPNTTYHLKVLVNMKMGHETCTAERGRVYTVTFNTTCTSESTRSRRSPDGRWGTGTSSHRATFGRGRTETSSRSMTSGLGGTQTFPYTTNCRNLLRPERLTVDATSAPANIHDVRTYSLDVSWQAVSYLDMCDLQYQLWVTAKPSWNYQNTFYTKGTYWKVEGLEANTEYTVSLRTCDQTANHCSYATSTTKRTLPGELDVVGHLQCSEVYFTWTPKSGTLHNLQFRTQYEINSNGNLVNRSSWSDWNYEKSRTIPVPPYSTVTLKVNAKNDGGQVTQESSPVRVLATDLPRPERLTVSATSSSFDVRWQAVSDLNRCDLQYELQVTSMTPGEHETFNTKRTYRRVWGLEANTGYTVSLRTCDQNKRQCSVPISTTKRTLPGELNVKSQLQDGGVYFTWEPESGGVNNVQFRTQYEIRCNGNRKVVTNSSWSAWNSVKYRKIPVPPYSTVTLRVQAKNDGGQVTKESSPVWTDLPKPERLTVDTTSSSSFDVRWQAVSHMNRCDLQYKVQVISVTSRKHIKTSYTKGTYRKVEGLEAHTEYTVYLSICDQNKRQCSVPISTTKRTLPGVPSQIMSLTADATESSLTFAWQPPTTFRGDNTVYSVSLYRADNGALEQNISVTAAQTKFEGLSGAREYLAKVVACNSQHCGVVKELSWWTRPSQPRLQGNVSLVEATDTTITILLPLLTNPPGWHWVTVQKEGRQSRTVDWKEKLKKDAVALVDAENNARNQRTAVHEVKDETVLYLTAKVQQEGNERLEVTVGDNETYERHYHNRPLKKDTAYWIVVVTEKRGGSYVERVPNSPQRFVATLSTSPWSMVGVILGMAAAAVVLAVVAAMVVVYFRKRRSRLVAEQQNDYNVDAPDGGSWPDDSPIPMVTISDGHQNNFADEDIYGNVTLEVMERDLEAYLLRAVTSRETKIEFDNVPSFMSSAYSESDLPENRSKNRYRNKVTYDDTRVILPLYDNIPHSDYINANFVEGPNRPAAFIATQGPKEETVGAFWRMMWHTNCRLILMVAKLQEGRKVKVAKYWPEKEPWIAEGVTVTPTGVTVKMDFVKRTFTMSVGNTHKEIIQYQYTGWPDHGVPKMPYGVAQMVKLSRRDSAHSEVLTVHCSAGIGRTGTVILVMYLLDQLQACGAVNPSEALMALRRGRGRLVENAEQYIFVHQVLHEVLFGPETSFPCHSFEDQLSALRSPQYLDGVSPLQQQYQKLKNMPKDLSFKHGKDPACAHLNRNKDILPADSNMVFVQGKGYGPDAQYLNVIRFNGIDQKDAYLAGEHPQRHTLGKMWRLVYERKVPVWVLLHAFPNRDPEFPDVVCESSALQDNMTLKASSKHTFQNYDERQVDICVNELDKVITHRCLLISLKGWPATDCLPASPEPLLSVIERTEVFSSQQQPPLITCKDGVTGCGVMAALLVALSRAKLLQEVDIYRSVASVQQSRPQFVVNHEQYDFLHTAMAAFLSSNSLYGNFN